MITFDAFLHEVRGHAPYPWQLALADRFAAEDPAPEDGPRPLTITVPTGSGKTTVVDVLVWALAAQADRHPRERTVGTRIVWAIDRRILVDEVHAQTALLATRLTSALGDPEDVLHEVAARLEGLKGTPPVGGWTVATAERSTAPAQGGGARGSDADGHPVSATDPGAQRPEGHDLRGTPLEATRWRGGLTIGARGRHPLQVEVISSTVAQIGSRLLFRGYGLADRSLPLGAALAASDVTICLDEAHLAEPFAETVQAIRARRREAGDTLTPSVRLVRLSATARDEELGANGDTADADDADLPLQIDLTDADEVHPQLRPRLVAPKHAALVEPEGTTDKDQQVALLAAVDRYLAEGRHTIACVVNSVRTARELYERLAKRAAKSDVVPEVVLLVGPQRPTDRAHSLERAIARAVDDGSEDDLPLTTTPREALLHGARTAQPLVVVATQTFEVGLDADVDALVTQSASASALAQRLGRLNRTGRLNAHDHADGRPGATHPAGHATIVRQVGFPLYADDEERAWTWLSSSLPKVLADGAVDADGADDADGVDDADLADPTADVDVTPPRTDSATAADRGRPRLTIDVSVVALRATPPPATLRRSHAAELTDQALELLTQTSPRPHASADPDIDAFLRGTDSEPDSDVTICWRADLAEDDTSPGADAYRESLLRLAPPHRDEQLTLSVGAARNLLRVRTGEVPANATARRRQTAEIPDVEGEGPPLDLFRDDARHPFDGIPFLIRRGDELLRGRPEIGEHRTDVQSRELRPGDLLILPAALGGVDQNGLYADEPDGNRTGTNTDKPDSNHPGKDVGLDVRPPSVPAAPNEASPARPTSIRLTFGALNAAYADVTPRPGPRAQRVRRLLRRVAAIERRIDVARDAPGRVAALRDLFTELRDHPALTPTVVSAGRASDGRNAAGLRPEDALLRRLTPELPSELTDPADDPVGVILGVPSASDGGALFFGDDSSGPDDEDDPSFFDPPPGGPGDPYGDPLAADDGSTGGVLLPGEDRPMETGGWVLLPRLATAKDRVRPRTEPPPTLAAHAQDVADRTAWFALAAGLPDELVRTLVLAARVHDHGKADPRMQAFFRGGTQPPLAEAIAKSLFGTDDRRADRTARLASGFPSGWRHELASAVILAEAWANDRITSLPEVPGRGIDIDLALQLVVGHHGAAHPLPPVPGPGTPPRSFAVDVAGVAGSATGADEQGWDGGAPLRRLERLTARYGVWTLAYLQSLLVLADRTVSAEGR